MLKTQKRFILRVPPEDADISKHPIPTAERAEAMGVSLEGNVNLEYISVMN